MDAMAVQHADDGHTWQVVAPAAGDPARSALFYCLHCAATETVEERRVRLALQVSGPDSARSRTGREILLSPSESKILALLTRHLDTTVPTEEIAQELWPDAAVDARIKAAIRAHVYTLRRKLHDSDLSVVTRSGIGYRASATRSGSLARGAGRRGRRVESGAGPRSA